MNEYQFIDQLEGQLILLVGKAVIDKSKEYKTVKLFCLQYGLALNEYCMLVNFKPRGWALPRLIRLAFRLDIPIRLCYDEVQDGSNMQFMLPFDPK